MKKAIDFQVCCFFLCFYEKINETELRQRIRKLIKEALSEVDTVNNNAEGKPLIARQDF